MNGETPENLNVMKLSANLLLMLAIAVYNVLNFLINDEFTEGILLLSLASLVTVINLVKLKINTNMKKSDRISIIISIIVIIGALIFVIFRMQKL